MNLSFIKFKMTILLSFGIIRFLATSDAALRRKDT